MTTQPIDSDEIISLRTSSGAPEIEGSREALRRATVLLEVLSGLRGPTEGAAALEVNLTYYYSLEAKALQGMIAALEPRKRGRRPKPAEERIPGLEAEVERLKVELTRAHALVRQAQRALGLKESAATKTAPAKGKAKTKARRGKPRAAKVLDKLKQRTEPEAT